MSPESPAVSPQDATRRAEYARRWASRRFLAPLAEPDPDGVHYVLPRAARCGTPLGAQVGIWTGESDRAHWGGMETCGSIWACPRCSRLIRHWRAAEIEHAAGAHQAAGGDLLLFTGTVRHHAGDSLETTLGALMDAWKAMTHAGTWRKKKKALGISGYIRAVEITHGKNGWHPHIHALLFVDSKLSKKSVSEFKAWIFNYWINAIEKAGAKKPNIRGLDLQQADKKGRVIARYISKIQDEKNAVRWGVGAEMARGDKKTGRGETSLTPFELLDDDAPLEKNTRARLWREYYTTTHGRRCITWSGGLKARYDVKEVSDADAEELGEKLLVYSAHARDYRAMARSNPTAPAEILEYAERDDWDAVAELLPGKRTHAKRGAPLIE